MGLFKRKKVQQPSPINVLLPGIKLPSLASSEETLSNAALKPISLGTKILKYATAATLDTDVETLAKRMGLSTDELILWNPEFVNGAIKKGTRINLNLTNDLARALMRSVDELKKENERRITALQSYIDENKSALKLAAFMNGKELGDLSPGVSLNTTYRLILQDTNLREDLNSLEHENWKLRQSAAVKLANFDNHIKRNNVLNNSSENSLITSKEELNLITSKEELNLIRQYLQDPSSEDAKLFFLALSGNLTALNPEDNERYRNINDLAKKYLTEINGTQQILQQQFSGNVRDAINTAGKYGLAASAVVGGAMALPFVGGALVRQLPGMVRDMVLYNTVIDPATDKIADAAKLLGAKRTIFKNALGFGTSAVTSRLLDRGIIAGMQMLRNGADAAATSGKLLGKQLSTKSRINLTKVADKLENGYDYASRTMLDPIRSLNGAELAYDVTGTALKNGAVGAAYGAVENYNPSLAYAVPAVAGISPRVFKYTGHAIKRLAALNSKGQKTLNGILDKINLMGTAYQGFLHNTFGVSRLTNGQKAAFSGVTAEGGMLDVAHTMNGNMPFMHKWSSLHKGATYNSPYWELVNPERFIGSKTIMDQYNNTGWMNRRSWGDNLDHFSPQSSEEFISIAKQAKNKDGLSMYDYLKQGKLSYDLKFKNAKTKNMESPLGDLILANNSAIWDPKNETHAVIQYNQNGNRLSSQIFTTPEGHQIHLGSDFGGSGSGGASDAGEKSLRGWIVLRLKSSLDLGSYSLPVTTQMQSAVFKNGKLTSNNTIAYHRNGLPTVHAPISSKKRFHWDLKFKRGGKLGIRQFGI